MGGSGSTAPGALARLSMGAEIVVVTFFWDTPRVRALDLQTGP